jgi:hypothetical protein
MRAAVIPTLASLNAASVTLVEVRKGASAMGFQKIVGRR